MEGIRKTLAPADGEAAALAPAATGGAQHASPAQELAGWALISGIVVFVIGPIENPEASLESRLDFKEF